jgi:hypothetical protein
MGKLLANDFLRQGAPMKQIGIGVCALLWPLPAGTKSMGVHALRGRLEKKVLLYTLASSPTVRELDQVPSPDELLGQLMRPRARTECGGEQQRD